MNVGQCRYEPVVGVWDIVGMTFVDVGQYGQGSVLVYCRTVLMWTCVSVGQCGCGTVWVWTCVSVGQCGCELVRVWDSVGVNLWECGCDLCGCRTVQVRICMGVEQCGCVPA